MTALGEVYVSTIAGSMLEYFAVCGAAYALFYLVLARRLANRKITQRRRLATPLAEIRRTIISSVLGKAPLTVALAAAVSYGAIPAKWIYSEVAAHGWLYFAFTIVADVVIFDVWFYLSHRFVLHSRLGYRYVHIVHHRSIDPTPFARNSVHPLEGIGNGLFHVLPIFLFPHHPAAIVIATHIKGAVGVLGHLGYEVWWSGFTRHRVLRYFVTPVHHHLHHARSVRTNFSFLINWDALFGTLDPTYHDAFETTVHHGDHQ